MPFRFLLRNRTREKPNSEPTLFANLEHDEFGAGSGIARREPQRWDSALGSDALERGEDALPRGKGGLGQKDEREAVPRRLLLRRGPRLLRGRDGQGSARTQSENRGE